MLIKVDVSCNGTENRPKCYTITPLNMINLINLGMKQLLKPLFFQTNRTASCPGG